MGVGALLAGLTAENIEDHAKQAVTEAVKEPLKESQAAKAKSVGGPEAQVITWCCLCMH